MKKAGKFILYVMGVLILGIISFSVREAVPAAAALTHVVEVTGQTEMPWIFKYMIFSLVGVVLLAMIAAIYVTVKGRRRK